MSKRSVYLLLKDIVDAIRQIEEYINGYDFETFSTDPKTVDAVVRKLEIIGEASNHINNFKENIIRRN